MSEESFKLWYKQQIWPKYSTGVTLQVKTRATQIFNVAAIFQYGRHGPSWNPIFFALKGQKMVEKDNYDDAFYVLTTANVQIML